MGTNKINSILQSLTESKEKYIEVKDKDGSPMFKMMLLTTDKEMVDLLDTFFDNGYKVEQISKENFDSFTGETHNFNY